VPLQTDAPTGIGARDEWGLYGAAPNKLVAVATDDGDTSLIYAATGGRSVVELFTFPTIVGVADPVTAASVTTRTRNYANGGGGREYYAWWNGVRVGANRQNDVDSQRPNYATVTYATAGAGLALAAVNGEHGWEFIAAGGPSNKAEYWMTQCYRTVDFTYPSGSAGDFSWLIASLVGAIGANLLMRDMGALARAVYRRTRVLIKPSEYDDALLDWKREKHLCLVGA
jgi:hypothetical protein